MSVSTSFRTFQPSDQPALVDLIMSLYREDPSMTPRNVMTPARIERTFAEFSGKPDKGRIISFERDGALVGYAVLVFFWSNEYGGDIVDIDELFVHEDHRGSGVGAEFFAWMKREWNGKAAALSLQTTPSNERAALFYQRIGFRPHYNAHYVALLDDLHGPA